MTAAPPSRRLGDGGRWCARHPWRVIASWLLVLGTLVTLNAVRGGTYRDDYSLPGSSVQRGADLITAAADGNLRGVGSQLVVQARTGKLTTHRQALDTVGATLSHLPHVLSVTAPLTTPGGLSQDERTGYFTVRLADFPSAYGTSCLTRVEEAVKPLRADGLTVEYGSPLGELARPPGNDRLSELIGLVTAVAVLILGFGSIAAAAIPLVTSMLALLVGLSSLGLLANAFTFATPSPTVATMMGLGAGLDYTLFLTTRHRRVLRGTSDPVEAAGAAMATGGHAVLIAVAAVILALTGLCLSGTGFIATLAVAAGITVLVAAAASLTLAPALFGLLGRNIDRFRLGRPVDEATGTADLWYRWSRALGRHPCRFLAIGVLAVGTLSIPLASVRLGHIDAGSTPGRYTDRRAYELIAKNFGPGANGPLTVVVELRPARTGAEPSPSADSLSAALIRTPGVAAVSTPAPTADRTLLIATVTPEHGPQDRRTADLLHRLDRTVLPKALAGTGARGYITGLTAARLTFADVLLGNLPTIIAFVTGTAFLLLLVTFRGLLVAAKAALLNLFSIGAALGVVVAVFQEGWGGSLVGITEPVPIEPYVPVLVLTIVFGLSMDYEIFLIVRIRETWLRTGDNHESVATGLAATARVITSAAVIMTSVFLAFLLSTDVVIKMIALGLGASVIIDATLMRLLLVPATMHLLGNANWWLPDLLRRRSGLGDRRYNRRRRD
ncbi:MMPL family transporter [Streptomyces hesseae]|uniref:MMPL family transporter n=1 Tax=Streptomyces hesseae TaxID=3075519 RepID=A0ABU2SH26_9ACTN|nr:MMPL family transporter [Streptomyces sp. DSM 40473]MDT0448283.1 MMPL family transporter [Streptomyces sp. DSM 40473]